jgi:hypothetical protein
MKYSLIFLRKRCWYQKTRGFDEQNPGVRLTMVALISVGRSLGSSVIRVAFGLIRFVSSRSVIG